METTEDMIKRLIAEFMVQSFSETTFLKANGKINDLVDKDVCTYSSMIIEQLEYIKKDLGLKNSTQIIEDMKNE